MAILTISWTVPDSQVNAIKDDFAAQRGWKSTLPDGSPNPESQNAFIKRDIGEYIKDNVKSRRVIIVSNAAIEAELANQAITVVLT